jgi:hypothetical protein
MDIHSRSSEQQLRELFNAATDAIAKASTVGPLALGRRSREDVIEPAIRALLSSVPKLQDNAMLQIGNIRMSAVWTLPQFVLNRARTKGPDDAVRWLNKVLSAPKVSILRVMPLWGLDVSQALDLTERIRLVPLSDLPNLPPHSEPMGSRLGFDVPMYQLEPPKTALVARIEQELINSSNDVSEYDFSIDALLEELRLCLSLVCPSAIVAAPRQSLFEDPDFADLAKLSGFVWRTIDIRPIDLRSFGAFDVDRAQRLVRGYLALDADTRRRIHLALDRFDRALRRHTPGDAAMELAITLDSLLGDGEGELTWKVGLRSALLVGGTKSERSERRAIGNLSAPQQSSAYRSHANRHRKKGARQDESCRSHSDGDDYNRRGHIGCHQSRKAA